MYLLTFATIIIGMIGIYAQVLAAQTARIAAGQTGLASAMLTWEGGAVSLAGDIIRYNAAGYAAVAAAGCSLSINKPTGFNYCPAGSSGAQGSMTLGANTLNSVYNATKAGFECVRLQPFCGGMSGSSCNACTTQYNIGTYQFYSVLYKDSGTGGNYVVTYVPPPTISAANPAPGFITMAGGNMIGFTVNDLTKQLQKRNAPIYAYGSVVGNKLKPTNTLITGSQFNLPANIPNGSLAVIASPDGM